MVQPNDNPVTTLFHYYRIFRRDAGPRLWVLCVLIFLSGLLEGFGVSLLLPVLNFQAEVEHPYVMAIHDVFTATGIPWTLVSILALMVAVFLLKGVFLFLQEWARADILTRLTADKRMEVFAKYRTMNYRYYTEQTGGFLNNVITTEIDRSVSGLNQFTELLVTAVYILVYTGAACLMNVRLTLLVLALCASLFVLLKGLSRMARRYSLLVSEKNAQIQELLIQIIHHFKYLKATHAFGPLQRQLDGRIEENRRYNFLNSLVSCIPACLLEPLAVLLLGALVAYYVGWKGQPLSEILVLLVFFYRSFSKMFTFQIAWQKFHSRLGGVEVLENVSFDLDRNSEPVPATAAAADPAAGVVLEQASLSIRGHAILHEIDLTLPPQSTVALVGESGAGKTTVLDLLCGLVLPTEGRVAIGGRDYRDLDVRALRSRIGYVTQEPVVFHDSIANNISLWAGPAGGEDLRQKITDAARLAHCLEFVERLPGGLDTVIGDRGVKLSVGQRQRIAIARELFKSPQIVFFDEATSALDSESERLIQESIDAIMGTVTMVIVAHRLSTIRKCDYVYVFHKGRIVEQGSYDQLQGTAGSRFARMCEAQRL